MTPTPHDALFKAVFSDPHHAAGALRAALPPAMAARFDFGTLALEPGSFIDEELAATYSDLLFSVRLAGRPARLYILYEHRSTPHRRMPFRALKYAVRILDDWDCKHPEEDKLPAVVCVVLHHGEGGWRGDVAFEDQLDLAPADRRALGPHVPRFRLIVDDIGRQDDAALRRRAMTALGRLTLFCFRYARDPDELLRRLGRLVGLVREVTDAPNGVAAFLLVVHYICVVGSKQRMEKLRVIATKAGKDVAEAVVTYVDQLRAEGEKKGERRGARKGRQSLLLLLLRTRFGELPEPVAARVQGAKVGEIEQWSQRLLTAAALDDVFAGA